MLSIRNVWIASIATILSISRINKRAYDTVVNIVHAAVYRAQVVHNEEVKEIETDQVIADET